MFMQVIGENETFVTEFVLTGCTGSQKSKMEIVAILLIAYATTVVGNGLIVFIIICDPRLHNPMYFFLCNLSFVDLCFATAGIPQSIVNCLADTPVITFPLCVTQAVLLNFFPAIECCLLVIMAYDRYVAISRPLHYVFIMNKTICILLTAIAWTSAFVAVLIPCVTLPLRFCENNKVDHLACEGKALFKLLCANDDLYQIAIYAVAIILLVLPLGAIIFSYTRIFVAVIKMHSEGSRRKAFSTCGSHLVVVTMFFGTAISAYAFPQSKETYLRDKIVTAFYAVLTPMFNPLIYALRNKDILGALKRLLSKKSDV